jgi:DNA-binding PadR family transcriptional regulator
MTDATPRHPEPLTPAVFHVLLALSQGPLHGYAVMRQVEAESRLTMGPGTVYGSLSRLTDLGWVEDAGGVETDPRRGRRYRITPAGRRRLEAEVGRMTRLAELARGHGLAMGGPQ